MAQNTPFDSKRGKALKVENAADFIAVFVATGFGSGFIPFAPGTWGSIVGLLIAYGLIAAFGSDALFLQNILIAAGLRLRRPRRLGERSRRKDFRPQGREPDSDR